MLEVPTDAVRSKHKSTVAGRTSLRKARNPPEVKTLQSHPVDLACDLGFRRAVFGKARVVMKMLRSTQGGPVSLREAFLAVRAGLRETKKLRDNAHAKVVNLAPVESGYANATSMEPTCPTQETAPDALLESDTETTIKGPTKAARSLLAVVGDIKTLRTDHRSLTRQADGLVDVSGGIRESFEMLLSRAKSLSSGVEEMRLDEDCASARDKAMRLHESLSKTRHSLVALGIRAQARVAEIAKKAEAVEDAGDMEDESNCSTVVVPDFLNESGLESGTFATSTNSEPSSVFDACHQESEGRAFRTETCEGFADEVSEAAQRGKRGKNCVGRKIIGRTETSESLADDDVVAANKGRRRNTKSRRGLSQVRRIDTNVSSANNIVTDARVHGDMDVISATNVFTAARMRGDTDVSSATNVFTAARVRGDTDVSSASDVVTAACMRSDTEVSSADIDDTVSLQGRLPRVVQRELEPGEKNDLQELVDNVVQAQAGASQPQAVLDEPPLERSDGFPRRHCYLTLESVGSADYGFSSEATDACTRLAPVAGNVIAAAEGTQGGFRSFLPSAPSFTPSGLRAKRRLRPIVCPVVPVNGDTFAPVDHDLCGSFVIRTSSVTQDAMQRRLSGSPRSESRSAPHSSQEPTTEARASRSPQDGGRWTLRTSLAAMTERLASRSPQHGSRSPTEETSKPRGSPSSQHGNRSPTKETSKRRGSPSSQSGNRSPTEETSKNRGSRSSQSGNPSPLQALLEAATEITSGGRGSCSPQSGNLLPLQFCQEAPTTRSMRGASKETEITRSLRGASKETVRSRHGSMLSSLAVEEDMRQSVQLSTDPWSGRKLLFLAKPSKFIGHN